ncbi:MAG: hypothetical protein IM574_04185 [Cytophagales bacterium]|jgi:uncharacterized membrane protein YsdA (DUF1294 family)|nr:hypothetical protein [Cytophagales bacterium]MCA6386584.1 hypothetical protein [Cytophagales bacterium]MCA6389906.1 hypothetical protein [Cytophagales bacterium]MCA6395212.1 hypothetical protein [Cytophagales bacterium]MCA6398660.1 hypothetical protein [Cytophagales bacterium]
MGNYNFEYTNSGYAFRLLGLSFLSFILLIFAIGFLQRAIGSTLSIVVVTVAPFLLFWLNKKKIKRQGSVNIDESHAEFKLQESSFTIRYAEIKHYKIELINDGDNLVIGLEGNKKIKIAANGNFCNSTPFKTFCRALDEALKQYQSNNQATIEKKKSFFEQPWVLPFLVTITVGYFGAIVTLVLIGKKVQPLTFLWIGFLVSLWVSYLAVVKKNQKK